MSATVSHAMRCSTTCRTSLDTHDAGEHLRSLRVLGSPLQGIRMIFDLMPRDTEEDWRNIAARMALVSARDWRATAAASSRARSSPRQVAGVRRQNVRSKLRSGQAPKARLLSFTGCWTPMMLPGCNRTRCAGTLQPVRTPPPAHTQIWDASSQTST